MTIPSYEELKEQLLKTTTRAEVAEKKLSQMDEFAFNIQAKLEEAEKALRNCRLLATRDLSKDPEGYGHILRFCKEAGITGNILRGENGKTS